MNPKLLYNHIYMLALCAMLAISSCASVGYENVDTARKAIVVSTAEVRAANLLLQDLVERRAIGRTDAANALQSLQRAKDLLQETKDALEESGDPFAVTSGLERVSTSLNIAMRLLAPLLEE